ncbi:MAG: response regulator, partial [Pseudohongiellaceae bacterium]
MPQQILIVEDEVKLATLLQEYLVQSGFEATVIHDGAAVESWLASHQPSLVLLDLMLPGKSGMEICKEIRKTSALPVIMITAKVDEIDRLLGLELGADDYICKPFSPREVVARVRAVLRRSEGMDKPGDKGLVL